MVLFSEVHYLSLQWKQMPFTVPNINPWFVLANYQAGESHRLGNAGLWNPLILQNGKPRPREGKGLI